MGRKRLWAKSSNGPDWTDIEVALRAVGTLTPGIVSLTVFPRGAGVNGGVTLALAWSPSLASVDGEEQIVLTESVWPCPEGCTFEGHVFAGIVGLDAKLEMLSARGELPK